MAISHNYAREQFRRDHRSVTKTVKSTFMFLTILDLKCRISFISNNFSNQHIASEKLNPNGRASEKFLFSMSDELQILSLARFLLVYPCRIAGYGLKNDI